MKNDKSTEAPATDGIEIDVGGTKRVFEIENPELPDWVDKKKLTSGGFPYAVARHHASLARGGCLAAAPGFFLRGSQLPI